MIRLLKLSTEKCELLSSEDVLSIHLGYFLTHGKVAYSTDVAIAEKPKCVILTLGNVEDICYVCEVEDYAYKDNVKASVLSAYTPDVYKNEERKTWLLFSSMQKVPVEFLDRLRSDTVIRDFIRQRSNSKSL